MSWDIHRFTFSIMDLIFSKIETKQLVIFEISTFSLSWRVSAGSGRPSGPSLVPTSPPQPFRLVFEKNENHNRKSETVTLPGHQRPHVSASFPVLSTAATYFSKEITFEDFRNFHFFPILGL